MSHWPGITPSVGLFFALKKGEAMPDQLRIMLNEPSTWRGIVSILTACGIGVSPDQLQAVIVTGLAVSGAIGVFFKDDKGAQ